ncbi:sensor histidine kinase [Saccharopolyspora sp. NPDC002376]
MFFPGKAAWQSTLWLLGILLATPVLMLLDYVIYEGFDETSWPVPVLMSAGAVGAVVLLIAPRLGPRELATATLATAVLAAAVYYPVNWDDRPDVACALLTPTAVLLVLLGLVVWRAEKRWVVTTTLIVTVTVVAQPAIGRGRLTELVIAFLLLCSVVLSCTIGLAARLARQARLREIEHERLVQRTDFARDLHDFVGHYVTGMVVQARGAQAIAERSPQQALATLDSIAEAGTEAMESLHRMVGLLRAEDTATTAPLATLDEIATLVERFNRGPGPDARLQLRGSTDRIPPETSSTAHRVALEGLTNVRKHGRDVTTVRIDVERSDSKVVVRVGDDGTVGKISDKGYGLRGLRDRIAEVGGEFEHGPDPAGGWVIQARLPLPSNGGNT